MAQQTAVEWFIEQLVELDKQLDGRRKSDDSTVMKLNPTKIFKQAKQMEKEQIIKSNRDGVDMCVDKKPYITGEQYYNDTYKTQAQ